MTRHLLKLTLLFTCVVFLSGCVSSLQKREFAFPDSTSANQKMSVNQLLSQARGESAGNELFDAYADEELALTFSSDESRLTSIQEDQLHHFANAGNTTIKVDCAPAGKPDKFAAVSLAITRCNNINDFLNKRARKAQISMQPDLQPDLVRITQ